MTLSLRDGRTPVTAAVLTEVGRLDVDTVWIDAPEPSEVRVRPAFVGVCHSDLHYVDGVHATDLPEILGHEAAGGVEAVGANVTTVRPGDHVVTSLTMYCGTCRYCVTGRLQLCEGRGALRARTRPAVLNAEGRSVGTMGGVGGFAEALLIHQNGVARIDPQLPLDAASLLGCAVLTGVGAVTRSAQVPVGASVAVIGCGGIGVAAVQGAVLSGASMIVAIDPSAERREWARRFGATHTLDGGPDVVDEVRGLCASGVDYSFEAVGRQSTAESAFAMLAPGGTCTVLGMIPDDTPIRVPASGLYFGERRLHGAFIGSSRFPVDIPQLSALHRSSRLALTEMITDRVPLADIERAMAMVRQGCGLRTVIAV